MNVSLRVREPITRTVRAGVSLSGRGVRASVAKRLPGGVRVAVSKRIIRVPRGW